MSGDHTMKRRTRGRAARISLVLAAALGIAASAGAGPDEQRPPGGLIKRNAERLGLKGDALAAVQAVVEASGARHEQLLKELDAARNEMRGLLSKPVPDSAEVMAQADAIGAIETALHKNRLQAIMQIRALLTPEQRTELLRLREEEHAKRALEGGECGPDGEAPPVPTR
jgi:Spy/CpxP family protein refolding chaperone